MSTEIEPAVDDLKEIPPPAPNHEERVARNVDEHGNEIRKLSKQEMKRIKIRMERRQRLINRGVKPEDVERVMAEEDYAALPIDKKVFRLEALLSRSIQRFAEDIAGLRYNDGVLADAMDLNFRAFEVALREAGISTERQKEIIEFTRKNIEEERAKKRELERLAREQQVAEAVQQNQDVAPTPDAPAPTDGPPDPVADGATEFGG